jgi:hypothetical protein
MSVRQSNERAAMRVVQYFVKHRLFEDRLRVLLACIAFAAAPAFAAPKLAKATYNGYMNGMHVGLISEVFEVFDGGYRITSETKAVGLAVFVQRQPLRFQSRGQVSREGLRPASFEARRTAGDAPQVAAEFDWASGQVTLKHDGKVESMPVAPGTQDRLSMMYQFMFIAPGKTPFVEFSMTNGRKLDQYRYRAQPEVEIDTPIGRVKTVHLAKVREPGDTTAEVWLSTAHRYFPVKILIIEKDGMRYEQVIQSLELK